LPLVVAMLQGRFPGKDNMQMAGAMISILPVLILFFPLSAPDRSEPRIERAEG